MRLFGGDRIQKYMDRFGLEDDEALEAGLLSKTIENAQKKVEGKNFGIRKYVLQYDNVMNKQREIIYSQRRMVLDGEDLKGYIMGMMEELVDGIIDPVTMESRYPEEWDFDAMSVDLCKINPLFKEALVYTDEEKLDLTPESLKEDVKETFRKIYDDKEAEIGAEHMREAERMILLRVVDNRWMDHIDAMDQLKNGIGLRALGQQDPTAAYASEGFAMFDEMVADIREETVKYCYSMTLQTKTERRNAVTISITRKDDYEDEEMEQAAQERRAMARMDRKGKNAGGMPQEAPKEDKKENHTPIRRDHPKIGRNDPCPCGSGKKYKNCHGRFEN